MENAEGWKGNGIRITTSIKIKPSVWADFKSECCQHQLDISHTIEELIIKAIEDKIIQILPNKNKAWDFCVRMREIIDRITDKDQLSFYDEELELYNEYVDSFKFDDHKLLVAAKKLMRREMRIPEPEAKTKCISIFRVISNSQNLKDTKKLVGFHNLWRYMDYLNKYKWDNADMLAAVLGVVRTKRNILC